MWQESDLFIFYFRCFYFYLHIYKLSLKFSNFCQVYLPRVIKVRYFKKCDKNLTFLFFTFDVFISTYIYISYRWNSTISGKYIYQKSSRLSNHALKCDKNLIPRSYFPCFNFLSVITAPPTSRKSLNGGDCFAQSLREFSLNLRKVPKASSTRQLPGFVPSRTKGGRGEGVSRKGDKHGKGFIRARVSRDSPLPFPVRRAFSVASKSKY